MNQFEEYKKKYGHLSSDEKEMRRKFYTYLDEQNMMLEAVTSSSSSAVSGGGGGGTKPRPVPNFSVGQFITSWKTDNAGTSGSTQIQLPLVQNGDYYFQVSWGDGNVDIIQSWDQKEARHTYATAGTYTVTIGGTFKGFIFNNGGDRLKLLAVSQWGTSFTIQSGSFSGCSNMTISATDLPIIENLNSTFASCSSLTTIPNVNSWNISQVKDMSACFSSMPFNADISAWDTSNVIGMFAVFSGNSAFNQPIGSWNTSKVQYMNWMFYFASSFNQNIGSWDLSSCTSISVMFNGSAFNNGGSPSINNWNVSKCTDFNILFRQTPFNQPIGNWDVSKVTFFRSVFRDSPFNQDISSWNTASADFMADMFLNTSFNQDISRWNYQKVYTMSRFLSTYSSFSVANYNKLLLALAASPTLVRNVPFSCSARYSSTGTGNKVDDPAAARAYIISTYTWSISDGGLQP